MCLLTFRDRFEYVNADKRNDKTKKPRRYYSAVVFVLTHNRVQGIFMYNCRK